MNRKARCSYENGFFHVMVQGINKKYIFEKSIDKEEYLSLLLKYKEKFKIILLAYCIMDNHAHLLIYTNEIYEMSKYMRLVNSIFAKDYNRANSRVGYVFRDRFNSQYIDDKEYLLKCLRYIHMNPVKAKMVDKPEEYIFSSYNNFLEKNGFINNDVINKIFGDENNYLKKFLNISSEEIEVMDIDREKENFIVAVRKYIMDNNTDLESVKKDREKLKDFCKYLIIQKQYKQIQVADLVNCDIKKIYYIIKKIKETKSSPSEKKKKVEKWLGMC